MGTAQIKCTTTATIARVPEGPTCCAKPGARYMCPELGSSFDLVSYLVSPNSKPYDFLKLILLSLLTKSKRASKKDNPDAFGKLPAPALNHRIFGFRVFRVQGSGV